MRVPEFDVKGENYQGYLLAKCNRESRFTGGHCFEWSICFLTRGWVGCVYASYVGVYVGPVDRDVPADFLIKVIEKAREVHEVLKSERR